jgi:hypothetical protein
VGQNISAEFRGFSKSVSHSLSSVPETGIEPPPNALPSPEILTGPARGLFQITGETTTDAGLVECNRKIWGALASHLIGETEADFLLRYVATRRPPAGQAASLGAMAGRITGSAYSRSVSRKRPRSPDREVSRDRRRSWARSGKMPPAIRTAYTEGEASALIVILEEVRKHGDCRSPIDRIAALAGVCRTTVQNALHEARRLGHVRITERPQRGRKSMTNIVEIVSAVWRAWARIVTRCQGGIGSNSVKTVSPTKTKESLIDGNGVVDRPQEAWDDTKWRRSQASRVGSTVGSAKAGGRKA